MLFTKENLEALKEKVDIIDIFREEFGDKLEHAGLGNFEVKCPFHDDEYRSIIVNDRFQAYYCFECFSTGDVIDFLINYKNLSFQDACLYLAKKYNIKLEEIKAPERTIEKRLGRLEELCESILKFMNKRHDAIPLL